MQNLFHTLQAFCNYVLCANNMNAIFRKKSHQQHAINFEVTPTRIAGEHLFGGQAVQLNSYQVDLGAVPIIRQLA